MYFKRFQKLRKFYDFRILCELKRQQLHTDLEVSITLPGESFGQKFIPSQSELFRYLYSSQCESIRTNLKTISISFVGKRLKINPTQSDSIHNFYPKESERIRSKFSIRMNQNQSGHGLIFIPMNHCSDSSD